MHNTSSRVSPHGFIASSYNAIYKDIVHMQLSIIFKLGQHLDKANKELNDEIY